MLTNISIIIGIFRWYEGIQSLNQLHLIFSDFKFFGKDIKIQRDYCSSKFNNSMCKVLFFKRYKLEMLTIHDIFKLRYRKIG